MTLALEDIPEDLVITCGDLREISFCARGQREWMRAHDIDWLTFVRNGLSARWLYQTGDHHAMQAVEAKLERLA